MQLVDFTTLMAVCAELRRQCLPARLEQVYQRDRHTLSLCLRTLERRTWLTLAWHTQAARLHLDDSPPRSPDTFTFSQQLWHQLNHLALVDLVTIAPWERVLDLQFARRPGGELEWHLYLEVMGKYSNLILVNAENLIVTAAHQVNTQQSRVRPIQTGQPYQPPPALTEAQPIRQESQADWQYRVGLIPGPIGKNLVQTYQGVSSSLVTSLLEQSGLNPQQPSDQLTPADWERLFQTWQAWLEMLETETFRPGWLARGYTVLGWGNVQPVANVQTLVQQYYNRELNQLEFQQLRQQLSQKLQSLIQKLDQKAQGFRGRLQQADQAETYRQQADLLMAHLQEWQPGMKAIILPDFDTQAPVTIPLDLEKNAVQNAQALYKRHQKLKRTRSSVEPLLTAVETELNYLRQVQAGVQQCDIYGSEADLLTLEEIREELVQQQYLPAIEYRRPAAVETPFYRYQSPSGWDVLIGRNNRQNDQLSFRLATAYDLWFHSQEIPGSHVLLRVAAGEKPTEADLQFTADLAAYYCQARQSAQVPVVYTEPKHVYKPKGASPGMAIYKHEQVIWGRPQVGAEIVAKGQGTH